VGAAAVCAALAAASTSGSDDDAAALGRLRDVVVATEPLPARRVLSRDRVTAALELRRIPETFVAPDALTNPAQALGRRPAAPIPAGAYLVGSQLLAARPKDPSAGSDLEVGHRPVEITVSAAGPLIDEPRQPVDVIVTGEPTTGGGSGRTFVAALGVQLLALRPARDTDAPATAVNGAGELSIATLSLTREQALRLIHAQSFAREVRLIGGGGPGYLD
jgi:Flp pilus assembly protein CpaB